MNAVEGSLAEGAHNDANNMMGDEALQTGSFLERFDSTPEAEQWPLVRHWMNEYPIAFFKELREQRPILKTPVCTLIARFDDFNEVVTIPRTFTVELYKPKMGDYLMAEDDTPMHNNEKAIMLSLLKREDLPRIREFIAAKAKETLDSANGAIDLVPDYARTVPTAMVQEHFGLDGINPKHLIKWSYWNQYDSFHNQFFHDLPNADEIIKKRENSNRWLGLYIGLLIARKWIMNKLGKSKDDVVYRILQADHPKEANFNIFRQGINAGGLLIGAVETTSMAVSQAVQGILDRPEILSLAVTAAKEGNNEAFDPIVWEALRFNPAFKYMFRTAAEDYTVASGTEREILITKGTTIMPLMLSAMFDPAAFDDPETFNPARPYGNSFHFGFGSHECMGKEIGRVMIPEMVKQVLLRPEIQALGPIDKNGGAVPEHYSLKWRPS